MLVFIRVVVGIQALGLMALGAFVALGNVLFLGLGHPDQAELRGAIYFSIGLLAACVLLGVGFFVLAFVRRFWALLLIVVVELVLVLFGVVVSAVGSSALTGNGDGLWAFVGGFLLAVLAGSTAALLVFPARMHNYFNL